MCGLALDFCVSFTAKDAAKAGFSAFVVEDATRGISEEGMEKEKVGARTCVAAVRAHSARLPQALMREAGVSIISSAELPGRQLPLPHEVADVEECAREMRRAGAAGGGGGAGGK